MGRANCTVLLIDDEQPGLRLRRLVLEDSGFKVLSTSEIDEAMSMFQKHDVDVVVTDHLLGRLTAAGLALTMKRLKPHVPIVSLSGTTNVEEALKYADHFIGKAEGPEALISTLDEILVDRLKSREPVRVTEAPPARDPATVNALLAAIVEDSADAILSKTLDGTVTSWNRAAEEMYGYTQQEMIGKPVEKLLPEDRPDEIKHILGRLKRGERIFHFETVRVAKDGRKLQVALTISPIRDGNGKLMGASTIARDITELKDAEEALAKAEKLAVAGRMAATVAHEINNPLEAIGNILYLLRRSVESNPEARSYVERAQEELRRVSEITRLTLGMQRGSVGKHGPVQITKLLENVLTLYERKSISLGVKVTRDYEFDGTVLGSAGELRQVFSNLIVNAMDAMALSGDKLVVSVRRTKRWDTGEDGVRVIVLDNGPGIAPENRAKLFHAFHTTKGEQGTGIGLWVSRNLVTQHGGTVRVRSSAVPGRSGTCFVVWLPLKR